MITLVKWHEKQLDSMRKEMDDVFDRCFGIVVEQGTRRREWMPCVDVVESSDDVSVRIELPGLDPKDLDIQVEGRKLVIQGQKKQEEPCEQEHYRSMERSYGSFYREIELPALVDADKSEAVYKNGVLVMTLSKWKKKPADRVTVQVQ